MSGGGEGREIYLPEHDACFWVFDGGYAAVGIDFFEGLLLHFLGGQELGFVVQAEFFEDDGYFPRIWAQACNVSQLGLSRGGEFLVTVGIELDWFRHG